MNSFDAVGIHPIRNLSRVSGNIMQLTSLPIHDCIVGCGFTGGHPSKHRPHVYSCLTSIIYQDPVCLTRYAMDFAAINSL